MAATAGAMRVLAPTLLRPACGQAGRQSLPAGPRLPALLPRRRCSDLKCRAEQQPEREGEGQGAAAPPPPPAGEEQAAEPLAGQDSPSLQLPRDVIERMRTTVFSFDTFFVTSVENYQADGVLFQGNLRGDSAAAYAKLTQRLRAELGDAYKLYLLENKDERPVAVVLPVSAAQAQVVGGPLAEPALAVGFGAFTLATTLNIFGAEIFNAALLTAQWDPELVAGAAPGAAAFLGILVVHEVGHRLAAAARGVQLAPPLFIPAGLGLLGSFGAITRITSFVPDRASLAAVAAAGPLASSAAALAVMVAGAAATAGGAGGVELDVASFRESLLAGAMGDFFFGGGDLFSADAVDVSPLFVAGWAGLIINAINCIPAGELDGARIYLALCGRQANQRMGAAALLLLGLFGFTNSLSLFWLIYIAIIQRGPVAPCSEELTPIPDGATKAAAIAALALPLLVLLPFPTALSLGPGGLPDLPPTF